MSSEQRIKVGIGVMIFKSGKVLLGMRKSLIGKGEYAWPGGHIEYGESFEDCARREVREETGMEIKDIKFLRLWNYKTDEQHYIDLAFTAEWASGEPRPMEPNVCEKWDWYDLEALPQPLFAPEYISLDALKTGRTFYDA